MNKSIAAAFVAYYSTLYMLPTTHTGGEDALIHKISYISVSQMPPLPLEAIEEVNKPLTTEKLSTVISETKNLQLLKDVPPSLSQHFLKANNAIHKGSPFP